MKLVKEYDRIVNKTRPESGTKSSYQDDKSLH